MERIQIQHGDNWYYLVYDTKIKDGKTIISIRSMVLKDHDVANRVTVPGYKHPEIKQKLQDLYGEDVVVNF